MSEGKKLKERQKKGGHSYGTLGDLQTRVFVDEKQGLLEAKYVSEAGEITGIYQTTNTNTNTRSSSGRNSSSRRLGPGSGRSSASSGSTQHTSRSASKRSSVASYRETTKEGVYDLWDPRSRSRSLSSGSSGSSDEVFSRTSSSSISTHCHDITTDPPEDRMALFKLTMATVLSLIFMLLEYVGGYYSSSLAVLSDAGHLLSDFCGFLVSLVALCLIRRPPSASMSFGYYRAVPPPPTTLRPPPTPLPQP
ncbi:hypothetical protein Pcinc_043123 [Petrolisthes cinctipes]|uniref:Cation efflux protein transmembrane domain-containing protein n=1 Tax=Petrolisthes cinctipes TaxID=88211 RepID=A0AAE1EGD4_PETCI|nr:hypothetical protein Pcinc_043123 [Petrolisthes cinctipes]